MPAQQIFQILFASFAFILGASIGSFLNVCIYRMPRNLSVNNPRRSFCPSCKYQIPWYSNLPLITWLVQGGKCRNCKSPISIRYFLVELLTGLLFLATWWRANHGFAIHSDSWMLFLPWVVFVSMLVVATFIDFEWFIIPDEITIGGTVVGVLFSVAFPQMHGFPTWSGGNVLMSGVWSLVGAAVGFALLWLVSVGGAALFGKKTQRFSPPAAFQWIHKDDRAHLIFPLKGAPTFKKLALYGSLLGGALGFVIFYFTSSGESFITATLSVVVGALLVIFCIWFAYRGKTNADQKEWDEFFRSEEDTMVMWCEVFNFQGKTYKDVEIKTRYLVLSIDGEDHNLEKIEEFSGVLKEMSFVRDAMGFGDVKLIACIGAFLGWKAVLFTVAFSSFVGAVVMGAPLLLGKLLGRKDWSIRLPLGPFLAFAALMWVFSGPEIINWYLSFAAPAPDLAP